MRAVRVTELTGPDGVAVVDIPEPAAGTGVLIEIRAAGISFPDLLLSHGLYQMKPDVPFTLGIEGAGVVREAPADSGFRAGDEVVAFGAGAAAELMSAPVASTFRLPAGLGFEGGAALVLNYHTAYFALVRRAGVISGDTVLVHGAAGGVGTAAIQVARALGARVIAVVSSEEKEAVARSAGAEHVVRSDGKWRDAVRELTGGHGVDVVVDPVGGDRLTDSLRSLAPEGRLLVIGFTAGEIPTVKVNRLLFRNVSVVGAAWGEFIARRPGYLGEVAADLERMVAAGQVRPIIGRTYGFDQVPDALRDLEQRRAVGKLVLVTRQEGHGKL
jgi:NADPH2:quinone reductase